MKKHHVFKRCNRCGRKLNDKISIARGYGPRCWELEHKQPDLIFLLLHGSENLKVVD